MNLQYAVVQFKEDGTFSEIPTLWLNKERSQCKWPLNKNVNFLIKRNVPPESDWLLYDVEVECYCETFDKARKKAEDSNYSTSNDEAKGRGKRILHQKKFDDSYILESDSLDEDIVSPPPCLVAPKKPKTVVTNENEESDIIISRFSSCSDELHFNEEVNHLNAQSLPITSNPPQVTSITLIVTAADIDKLVQISVESLQYVKSIDKRLKNLERRLVQSTNTTNVFDDILPLDSLENLKAFDNIIELDENKASFVDFMKLIGGKNNKNVVQRCMAHLFTNQFGIKCSWCGRGGNIRVSNLKCIRILKGIMRTKGVDDSEFESVASEWLRLSKLRYSRENKKNSAPD